MTDGQVQAIELFARNCDGACSAVHARKVTDLAVSLFDQLQAMDLLPGMTASERHILIAASNAHDTGSCEVTLPDIGVLPSWVPEGPREDSRGAISCQTLRIWLENPPPPLQLNPLSPEDRSVFLYSVLWHTAAQPFQIPEEPLLDSDSATKLASILRLADGLAESPRNLVAGFSIVQSTSWIRVLVRSITDVSDEVSTAQQRSDPLARALGLRVFVQQVVE